MGTQDCLVWESIKLKMMMLKYENEKQNTCQ